MCESKTSVDNVYTNGKFLLKNMLFRKINPNFHTVLNAIGSPE